MSNKAIDKRIIKSKKALKDAMIVLMEKMDFKEITITDLVAIADVNRGTFYKHYQYKEDVLNDVLDDVIEDLKLSYLEPYKTMPRFELSKLTSSGIKLFEHVQHYSNFYTLIVQSDRLMYVQQKVCDVLKNLALQDVHFQKSDTDINAELTASFYSHALFGMITEWIHGGFKYSSSYMAEQLLTIIKLKQI